MMRALDIWLPAWLRRAPRPSVSGVTDIMLAVCDHFEPFHETDRAGALRRMDEWNEKFPRVIEPFRDADGIRPRHTFFYPIEQYDSAVLEEVRKLCDASGGETELHLHHNNDTADGFRAALERGKENFLKHGLLCRDTRGRVRFGFVHGDWALDNSHPQGRDCGVSTELRLLREAGCYADFTMPSAPDPTQTRTINSLYYALDTPAPKSHDRGVLARVMGAPTDVDAPRFGDLLLVQGPLGLNRERRKFGLIPRIENADLTGTNPPAPDRLRLWVDIAPHVLGRPEWIFIKLHSHGATPRNSAVFLGGPMRKFHEHLLANYNDGGKFRVHYVTAREMVNIIHAAEDGLAGNPGQHRDYRYRLTNRG